MTAFRKTEIASQLTRWLERYSPPMSIKDNPRAQQDEVESLLRVLLKFAPASDYTPWVNHALDRLEYQMKTRAWPTKGELGAVCSNIRKEDPAAAPTWSLDTYEIHAKRIRAGDPVGDAWLYGRQALELIERGLVSEQDLKPGRSGLFFAMREAWGEDRARLAEAAMIQRHEDAKATGGMERRDVSVPNKRSVPNNPDVYAA